MIRSRIAPTPSGYLHTGNAVNFVLTALWTRKENGLLRLRIDDIDAPRIRTEYIDDIFRTLDWLGLAWDEGPQSPDEHQQKFSQSLRTERYNELIQQIIQSGKAFACSCSRKEIGRQPYPGICREKNIPLNEPDTALRVLTTEHTVISIHDIQFDLYNAMRDFVIRRRDGIASYQIASLADDIDYDINLIIRGEDLIPSTAAQLYLSQLCNEKNFAQAKFYHHRLLTDVSGQKLSKSAGSESLKAWREENRKPEKFYQMMSGLLGWKNTATTFDEMLAGAKEGLSLKL